jgi:hypothetical protein
MGRLRQENALEAETIDRETRIYVGSAKDIYQSLYGDGKMPAPPTTKPEAMFLLQNTAYLVLDEVDRLLDMVGGVSSTKNRVSRRRRQEDGPEERVEPPAAILTAAVARLTMGNAVTVAASATVGRPLRRELARCLGLSPQECPRIIREDDEMNGKDDDTRPSFGANPVQDTNISSGFRRRNNTGVGRAVTIPETVRHYIVPVKDGATPGKILTCAYTVIQALCPRRILLVLTRDFGISTQNAVGALKHFQCQPEPISLLDVLETTEGTQAMMQLHRHVTGVRGVGVSATYDFQQARSGYLLVTEEERIRGLHLDGLDVVLVAARPVGPDEYTHIAGRTGRAGHSGHVINIVNQDDVFKVKAWENMLDIQFRCCGNPKEIASMLENVDDE